jgi:hypothetical protein
MRKVGILIQYNNLYMVYLVFSCVFHVISNGIRIYGVANIVVKTLVSTYTQLGNAITTTTTTTTKIWVNPRTNTCT